MFVSASDCSYYDLISRASSFRSILLFCCYFSVCFASFKRTSSKSSGHCQSLEAASIYCVLLIHPIGPPLSLYFIYPINLVFM
ncbi:hypothetical protein BX070DRAFT_229207 [Coemansia spiralis]|nr:hypothetical protein BX070DRAFT_229207 [Coemansia spiralis]